MILCGSSAAKVVDSSADSLPTNAPPVAVAQALVGNTRLVVWELPNGVIEAQALGAESHEPLPLAQPVTLGTGAGVLRTRPAVAGLRDSDKTMFLVAWHEEIVDGSGVSLGTEIVGRLVAVNDDGGTGLSAPMRLSRVDDDADETAASEHRSAPVVVASESEQEFLVLWTHWPNGKVLVDDPPYSANELFIYGQEIALDGDLAGEASVQLDALLAPFDSDTNLHPRLDTEIIFLAAAPLANEDGYLLAWSDPAQEVTHVDLPQLFTKRLPADLGAVAPGERNAIGASTSFLQGTGRIALAPMPGGSGYLLAFEDARGQGSVRAYPLDENGMAAGDRVELLGPVNSENTFLSPSLVTVPQENRRLLFTAVANRGLVEQEPDNGFLVRRVLDPEDLAFARHLSDFKTIVPNYSKVNMSFAPQAHVGGALPSGKGAVVFTADAALGQILIDEVRFEPDAPPAPPTPPSPPTTPDGNDRKPGSGGGAMLLLPLLLALLRLLRAAPRMLLVCGLSFAAGAQAAPPDVELLHTEKDGKACYRSVMYREVAEIRIAKSYNKTPIPAGTPVEIIDLPSGWRGEVIGERDYQWVKLVPAPFDTVSGISIGRVCLKLPAMNAEPATIPYTYVLATSGSPIMATARPDDGISDDELRAMIKRGERLKKGDVLEKPKAVKDTAKTLKRAKDLFD